MPEEKLYAIIATRKSDGAKVFWQNTGKPTVWQDSPGSFIFEKWIASRIASQIRNWAGGPDSDVFALHIEAQD